MKRTTRNNILRYLISVVFVSVLLLIASLLCLGFSWLDDKIGWPIYTVATVAGLIYTVWYVAQCITIKDEKEKDMQDVLRTEYEKGRADAFAQMQKEWSEEDEVKINRIVACLENLNVADNDILLKDVDWLKSLKQRIGG